MAVKDYTDPRWQRVRLRIMERDGFKCYCCNGDKKQLHVHHMSYTKGRRIWDESPDALVTVCEDCHEAIEQMVKDVRMMAHIVRFHEDKGQIRDQFIKTILSVFDAAANNPDWQSFALPVISNSIDSIYNTAPRDFPKDGAA